MAMTHEGRGSSMSMITAALRARSGHNFSEYEGRTLVRRLSRQTSMSISTGFATAEELLDLVTLAADWRDRTLP